MQKSFELLKLSLRYLFALSLALFFTWRAEIFVDAKGGLSILERLMCYCLALLLIFAAIAYSDGKAEPV